MNDSDETIVKSYVVSNNISGMYGMKGGNKAGRVYPNIDNVREEFYRIHPPSDDMTEVSRTVFLGHALFLNFFRLNAIMI